MEKDLLLGSLELPDFDGAFWFDKLDELGVGEIPGQSLSSAGPVVSLPTTTLDSDDPDAYDPLLRPSPPPQKRRRGRGRAKSNLSLEEKRAKNREIQSRYRMNQKRQQEELETTCIQVSKEIEEARRERAIAQQTNEVMEKVLVMRDAAVGILAKGLSSEQLRSTVSKETNESDGNSIKMIENPNCLVHETKSSDNNTRGSGEITTGDTLGSGGSSSRPVVQHKTLITDLGTPVHSIAEAYDAAKKLDEGAPEEIAAKNPQYKELVDNVRNMTGHQLVEGWREFALKLRHIIDAHEEEFTQGGTKPIDTIIWDKDTLPKLMEQIEPLFEENVTVLSTALRHNLPAVQALFNTAGEVGPDPMEYWITVAEKMEITPKQQEHFISLWNAYVSRLASLKEQRNGIVQSLMQAAGLPQEQEGIDGAGGEGGGGDGNVLASPFTTTKPLPVDSLHLMMERYCTLFDATGNVAATPDNELTALLDLMREAGNVWSLYQKAKLTAIAYPAFPDIVHFLKAVATRKERMSGGNGVPLLEQGVAT